MKFSMISIFAAALLALASVGTFASTAHAGDVIVLSDEAKMLVGEWGQDADRIVGEGDEEILISQGWEVINADGTSRANMRVKLLSSQMPDDLRVYDVTIDYRWKLIGEVYHSDPQTVIVTHVGSHPSGKNIAKMIEAEFMKPTEPVTIKTLNHDNYVARGSDGTLISMTRK